MHYFELLVKVLTYLNIDDFRKHFPLHNKVPVFIQSVCTRNNNNYCRAEDIFQQILLIF